MKMAAVSVHSASINFINKGDGSPQQSCWIVCLPGRDQGQAPGCTKTGSQSVAAALQSDSQFIMDASLVQSESKDGGS